MNYIERVEEHVATATHFTPEQLEIHRAHMEALRAIDAFLRKATELREDAPPHIKAEAESVYSSYLMVVDDMLRKLIEGFGEMLSVSVSIEEALRSVEAMESSPRPDNPREN